MSYDPFNFLKLKSVLIMAYVVVREASHSLTDLHSMSECLGSHPTFASHLAYCSCILGGHRCWLKYLLLPAMQDTWSSRLQALAWPSSGPVLAVQSGGHTLVPSEFLQNTICHSILCCSVCAICHSVFCYTFSSNVLMF